MSLTRELKDTGSPVRVFLDGLSAPLAATYGSTKNTAAAAQKLGFPGLVDHAIAVPLPEGVDATRVGTAFDIRTRMALGEFDLQDSTSSHGLEAMTQSAGKMKNDEHRVRILSEVFCFVQDLLAASPTEADLDVASLLLAPMEQFYRANLGALDGSQGEAPDTAQDGLGFREALDPREVPDIRNLRIANSEQIETWREHIAAGEPFEGNPSFVGALLVGGADGDWLAGDTLIGCKVYAKLTVPKLRDFVRQLLGYVMLDLDDALKIRTVGVWLPRQAQIQTWPLELLLGADLEVLLPKLREDFVKDTRRNQLAVHVPVTEERKLQLVADNRFSPLAMLRTLAHSDTRDLRFRVARNPATPEDVIRMLSEDHYAKVREGVANNRATPVDVLTRLATDISIVVRRAAASNLGGSLAQNRVLTATSEVPGADLVITTAQAELTVDLSPVRIEQDRDPEAINYELLLRILAISSEQGSFSNRISILPEASKMFAWRTGRQPTIPMQLQDGLPSHVVESMFEPSRPPLMRSLAANRLSIDDADVRVRLLTDDIVDIRWDALWRSVDCIDEHLSTLLAELVVSHEARVNFRTTGESIRALWQRPAEYSEAVLRVIAAHQATPQSSLHRLIDHKSPEVLVAVASNPRLDETGVDLLAERMLSIRSSESRQLFAESRYCPAVVLEKLARNRSLDIRLAVAENRSSSDATLELLAQAKEVAIRMAVLENPPTPQELATAIAEQLLTSTSDIRLLDALRACERQDDLALPNDLVEEALDRLAKSRVRDPGPRSFVAKDNRTAASTLVRLSKSADEHVRVAVAGNIRTSQETLASLLLDESLNVRIEAARNIEKTEAPDNSPETQSTEIQVATKPSLTIEELQEMASSKQAAVRQQAAYSAASTPDILTFLAGDRRSVKVRRAVASNPNTPPATLRSLLAESDREIIQSLAFNGATPADVLANIAGRSLDLALLVALNPDAPDGTLNTLVDDEDAIVRFAAQDVISTRSTQVSVGTVPGVLTTDAGSDHEDA